MKNLIGGILGVTAGAVMLVYLTGAVDPGYMPPYDWGWIIIFGGNMLYLSLDGLLNPGTVWVYIFTWFIMGLIASAFSQRGWNTVRTAIWVGMVQGLLRLGHVLLTDSGFWASPDRNLQLVVLFSSSVLLALLIVPVAHPLAILRERIRRKAEPPIPSSIETVCECGAVFKSNPLICSECGRRLRRDAD
ncbi:MAG: hypothetical protein ACP6KW_01675 [Candidatus Thorarchaeota archaeon]